jgi:hypothetical protein
MDRVLTPALDGLAVDVRDDPAARLSLYRLTVGQVLKAAERELSALGCQDRARIAAQLAMDCALLHHRLLALDPSYSAPSGRDRHALAAPLPDARKA